MINEFFQSNPVSGLLLTVGCYWCGQAFYNKTRWTFFQPILTASVIIIFFLYYAKIPYDVYYEQNAVLNYILPLTAVALAIPLYRNLAVLKRHALPILAGITAGTLATMGALLAACRLMGTDEKILVTMLPKSATAPIAMGISEIVGGIPSLTVSLVVTTGLIGGVFGPELLKLMRIKDEVAKGIAIGTISHAIGTARAFKESEIQGSMGSLAIAVAGVLTALLAPIFVLLL
ncbi:MAG TPA: LrgB family protein [Anaerovoracaceae bacterium]|nr:LrgB family protein [Anaerovoracaceae bacterium]